MNLIMACSDAFEKYGFKDADEPVRLVVSQWPLNTSYQEVLIKVLVLNAIYRTFLFTAAEGKLASRISSLGLKEDLDSRMDRGDPEVVKLIRQGHNFKKKTGGDWDFYSFATKYCCWHRPESYPMYDACADISLRAVAERLGFEKARSLNFRDYSEFKKTVDAVKKQLGLAMNYKQLDQGFWLLGKYLANQLTGIPKIADEISKQAELAGLKK